MRLVPRLILITIIAVVITMSAVAAFVISKIEQDMIETIDHSMEADATFAVARVIDKQEQIKAITTIISKERSISKAISAQESRGIGHALNDIVSVYPFINYILVTDTNETVFAVSDQKQETKTLSTNALLRQNITEHPMYAPDDEGVAVSFPGFDPYVDLIDDENNLSQWYIASVKQHDEVIGRIVISVDWETIHTDLLNDVVAELKHVHAPIVTALITDPDNEILAVADGQTTSDYQQWQVLKPSPGVISQSHTHDLGYTHSNVYVVYNTKLALAKITETSQLIFVAIVIGTIALGCILLIILRKSLLDRLNLLHETSRKMGAGEAERIPDLGKDEIGDLGRAMNEMAINLSQQSISLEWLNDEVKLREQVNSALEEQSKRFQLAVESAGIGVWEYDIQTRKLIWDERMFQIYGIQPEDFKGEYEDWSQAVHPDDLEDAAAKVEESINNRSKYDKEYRIIQPSGQIRHIRSASIITYGKDGQSLIMSGINLDLTDTKQHEALLKEAKDAAELAAQTKSEFLASMSHEIRTPMNGVLGMLSLLATSHLNEKQSHQLHLAQTSANSLLALINDILDFSKVEAGKLDLEEIDFNLPQVLGEFTEAMALRTEDKTVELILDTKEVEISMVNGDPGRLRQILTNIVGNALKFTEQGEIVIRASLHKAHQGELIFECSVEDTGIGIEQDKVKALFDAFTQADSSTTRRFGGTGLGLSITKRLCELMKGGVAATSEPGKGSTFTFFIHLNSCEKSFPAVPDKDISELSILVVDDNETNREVMKGQLDLWGAQVALATSADDALAQLNDANNQFDLALLDMEMPVMDGAELGRQIRSDKRFDSLKLVLMTSMSHRGDAAFFADLGFQAYFPKPVTMDDLFKALAVVADDGEALAKAEPLVTTEYLHCLDDQHLQKDNNAIPPAQADATQADHELQRARILLVEDNVVNQLVAKGMLENLGIQADVAANGKEAIDSLSKFAEIAPYDLVLMDCQMPEMDGYQATRAIRQGLAAVVNQAIPIVAMTANAMKGDKEKCLEAGMDDYVAKPINPDILKSALEKWLRQ